jgi:hypothetical protein
MLTWYKNRRIGAISLRVGSLPGILSGRTLHQPPGVAEVPSNQFPETSGGLEGVDIENTVKAVIIDIMVQRKAILSIF